MIAHKKQQQITRKEGTTTSRIKEQGRYEIQTVAADLHKSIAMMRKFSIHFIMPKSSLLIWSLIAVLFSSSSTSTTRSRGFHYVNAWGKEGHEIVADIAYQRLSAHARNAITNILFPADENATYDKTKFASPMSAVATWADQMRYTKDFAWTEPLHFVDIRDDLITGGCPSKSTNAAELDLDFALGTDDDDDDDYGHSDCSFVYSRDCGNGLCAVHAIQQMTINLDNDLPIFSTQEPNPNLNEYYVQHEMKSSTRTTSLRGGKSIASITTTPNMANFTMRQSLMFLIHFVGDIHQPLHVSRKSDIGGNSIHVSFPKPFTLQHSHQQHHNHHRSNNNNDNGNNKIYTPIRIIHKGWNLHSVWDTGMIEYIMDQKFNHSQSKYQSFIEDTYITEENIDQYQWNACIDGMNETCVSIWAEESWNDAVHWAYGNEQGHEIHNGDSLTEEYVKTRLPIVGMRLAAAGVRLASVLESLYSSSNEYQQEGGHGQDVWTDSVVME